MIALPSRLPLLQLGSVSLAGYDLAWVEENIRSAARDAGHDEWWFAADVARSLIVYLRDRFAGTTITLEEMGAKIRRTLERIGFSDVGRHVRLSPPFLSLSLHDLAVETGGFPLHFFQLLDARLTELRGLGARRVALTNARRGVKHLCAARHWSRDCRDMQENLLHFLRTRSAAAGDCTLELQHAA